jgi:hypothetical protein
MHADDELVAFQNEVCRETSVPTVKTLVPHRRAKILATKDGLARRSTWVATQGRHMVSIPEVQAQNVLIQKGDAMSEQRSPDTVALKAYHEL